MSAQAPQQREAGAARVQEWGNSRVFTPQQVEVIHGWADQLCADGPDAKLTPSWPSRLRSTQQTREETARRLFREGAA